MDGSNCTDLISEDITTNKVTQIGKVKNYLYTVLYDPKTRSLFAGDGSGILYQYQKSKEINSFIFIKNYGNIGLSYICSSSLVGDLAIFGGYYTFSLAAIKISDQQLCKLTKKIPFNEITSLQTCMMSKSKLLLSIGGKSPSFSGFSTDILEVLESIEDIPTDSESNIIEDDSSEIQNNIASRFNGPFSEKIMMAFLLNVFSYIDGLFCKFIEQYDIKLLQNRDKKNIKKVKKTFRQDDPIYDSELTEKLKNIIRDFEISNESKF